MVILLQSSVNPNRDLLSWDIDAHGLKIQGRGYLMFFVRIPGGVKAFRKNCRGGGGPYFGFYCIFINKCFEICLRGVLYLPSPIPPPVCIYELRGKFVLVLFTCKMRSWSCWVLALIRSIRFVFSNSRPLASWNLKHFFSLKTNLKSLTYFRFHFNLVSSKGHNHLLEIWLLKTGFFSIFQPDP